MTTTTVTTPPASVFDYVTTVRIVAAKDVFSSVGGVVQVDDPASSIDGVKLTVPPGALYGNRNVTMGEVSNPPALPAGLNYVGVPVDLGPDGTTFGSPATIEIPFSDSALSDAGGSSKTALKVRSYDKATGRWSAVRIISIDTVNNIVKAEVNHFSYYAITGLNGTPPSNLGIPRPGDLLYKLGSIFGAQHAMGWRPGHVGIYTGEKTYSGEGLASDDVVRYGKYNVVEALERGVQYSYYDIPNVVETESGLPTFNGPDVDMGAREPAYHTLTYEQRQRIVAFAEAQVGKPYAWTQTWGISFGMLAGSLVKGPDSFNCVGLAEKAYEEAGVNNGKGLTDFSEENFGVPKMLTPAEHYNKTKPASGTNPVPKINWASIAPNYGSICTRVLMRISVSHTYGLNAIDSVTYVTDDGYTNPAVNINDAGIIGDQVAGDGVYSFSGLSGGNPYAGIMGINLAVTDKFGKSVTTRLIFTYTGTYTGTCP